MNDHDCQCPECPRCDPPAGCRQTRLSPDEPRCGPCAEYLAKRSAQGGVEPLVEGQVIQPRPRPASEKVGPPPIYDKP